MLRPSGSKRGLALWELSSTHKRQKFCLSAFSRSRMHQIRNLLLFDYIYQFQYRFISPPVKFPFNKGPLLKSVHVFLSEICISESTPSTVTKRFWRLLLRRKQVRLHITTHSHPIPIQSEHRYDFVNLGRARLEHLFAHFRSKEIPYKNRYDNYKSGMYITLLPCIAM